MSWLNTSVQNLKKGRLGAVVCLSCLLTFALSACDSAPRTQADFDELVNYPLKLRTLSTDEVIRVYASNPRSTLTQDELLRRPLTKADAEKILNALTTWFAWDPKNRDSFPSLWAFPFIERLSQRGLVSDEQGVVMLQVLEGDLRLPAHFRHREGKPVIMVGCPFSYMNDDNKLVGLVMLNEMRSITVDGQPATQLHHVLAPPFQDEVSMPRLPPGKHVLKVEVLSSIVPSGAVAGMPYDAASAKWPEGKKTWIRSAEAELNVYPSDAVIVKQVTDSALDPTSAISIPKIVIYKDGKTTYAYIKAFFAHNSHLPVPISCDRTLVIGSQKFDAHWSSCADSMETRWSVYLKSVDRKATEAQLILTPNPSYVDNDASFDRIWGEPIVISHIPLEWRTGD